MNENSGGDVGYYALEIKHPKRFEPCMVECEDVIAALGLNFFEGEAFKAIWRKGAQRTLGVGKAGNTALRDAQKMAHYGARELAHEEQRAEQPTGWQVLPVMPRAADWVPHTGNEPPICPDGTVVEIKHRDGSVSPPEEYTPDGEFWRWAHRVSRPSDIVAARWSLPA